MARVDIRGVTKAFGETQVIRGISLDVAFDSRTDTTNAVYQSITHTPGLNIIRSNDSDLVDRLKKGRITALILITGANTPFTGFPFLANFIAGDSFLPRQLTRRGHRLAGGALQCRKAERRAWWWSPTPPGG